MKRLCDSGLRTRDPVLMCDDKAFNRLMHVCARHYIKVFCAYTDVSVALRSLIQ